MSDTNWDQIDQMRIAATGSLNESLNASAMAMRFENGSDEYIEYLCKMLAFNAKAYVLMERAVADALGPKITSVHSEFGRANGGDAVRRIEGAAGLPDNPDSVGA